ncbi:MAG: hypothetical protein K5Q68_14595 [Roseococcus sp.]|nr:hypothetical protein [Roseococcus sp.]
MSATHPNLHTGTQHTSGKRSAFFNWALFGVLCGALSMLFVTFSAVTATSLVAQWPLWLASALGAAVVSISQRVRRPVGR